MTIIGFIPPINFLYARMCTTGAVRIFPNLFMMILPSMQNGWQQRLNNYSTPKQHLQTLKPSVSHVPFHLLTHGAIGKMIRHIHHYY